MGHSRRVSLRQLYPDPNVVSRNQHQCSMHPTAWACRRMSARGFRKLSFSTRQYRFPRVQEIRYRYACRTSWSCIRFADRSSLGQIRFRACRPTPLTWTAQAGPWLRGGRSKSDIRVTGCSPKAESAYDASLDPSREAGIQPVSHWSQQLRSDLQGPAIGSQVLLRQYAATIGN